MMQRKNITLRALEPEDVDIMYCWENDTRIWECSNTHLPLSRHVLKKYVEQADRDIYRNGQLRLMIELKDNATPVGMLDMFDYDSFHQRAGIGILIHEDYRGQKIAKTALQLFVDYLFRFFPLHQLYCNIESGNTPSLALFKDLGFTECGRRKDWLRKDKVWADEICLQLLKADAEQPGK